MLGVSDQLEMALINLVVNAVHAMRERGGTLTVGTRLAGEHDVEISVSDEGSGIPDDMRATLFDPFVTTKPEGEGTGLGLSTVLMVVERHGGRVEFDTDAGPRHDLPDHAPGGTRLSEAGTLSRSPSAPRAPARRPRRARGSSGTGRRPSARA